MYTWEDEIDEESWRELVELSKYHGTIPWDLQMRLPLNRRFKTLDDALNALFPKERKNE